MFQYIDSYLLVFGVKVYRNHWIVKVINNLFFVLYAYDIVATNWIAIVKPDEKMTFWSRSSYSLYLLSSLFTQLLMRSKRTRIIKLVDKVNRMMTKGVRRRLLFAVALAVSMQLVSIIGSLYFWYSRVIAEGFERGIPRDMLQFYWWTDIYTRPYKLIMMFFYGYRAIARDQWALMSSLVYCYFAVAIEISKQNILAAFKQYRKYNAANIKESLQTLRHVDQLKRKFNDIFNVFPLLSFGFLFISMAGYIQLVVTLYRASTSFLVSLAYIVGFTKDLVLLFAVNCIVTRYTDHTSTICDSLTSRLYDRVSTTDPNQSHMTSLLLHELQTRIPYDAAGLFTLDRSMFLGFVGGVVSFTVMILQLQV